MIFIIKKLSEFNTCHISSPSWSSLLSSSSSSYPLLVTMEGSKYYYFFLFINAMWNSCELYSVLFSFVKDKSVISAGMVASEASKGMGPDEESFNVPVPVTQKVLTTLPCVLNFKQIINNDINRQAGVFAINLIHSDPQYHSVSLSDM